MSAEALGVDPPAPGAPRHLQERARLHVVELDPVELAQRLEGDRAGGHVDPERERLGREVSIETKIDEILIGGAVIKAGDVVIDGSLRSRLEGLANALAK